MKSFAAKLSAVTGAHSVTLLIIIYLAGMGLFLTHLDRLQQRLFRESAMENARLYTKAITEFRTLYTREVVNSARRFGMEITHDYLGKDHALPLPATLSMLLGKKISAAEPDAETRLYSPYPFPWREDESRALFEMQKDGAASFAQRAWQHWQDHPQDTGPYFEFVGTKLHYATADRMRQACVDCHNNHPSTPRRGWKVGDVRGILQVSNPTAALSRQARRDLIGVYGFAAAFGILGGLMIFGLVYRTRRSAKLLKAQVRQLAEQGVQLEASRRAADAAAEAKGRFVANISHEIRTPMNAVLGLTNLLLDTDLSDEQYRKVDTVHTSANALLALLDGVLNFSKLEAGQVSVDRHLFDLRTLLQSVVDLMAPLADEQRIGLRLVYDEALHRHYIGDSGKIRQVALNLMGNAVKFTREGTVEIAVLKEQTSGADVRLRIEVRDSGIGIDKALRQDIFEWFNRGAKEVAQSHRGSGLGLSISRHLVTLLGGEIGVDSEVGEGSTFWIEVPLTPYHKEIANTSELLGPKAPGPSLSAGNILVAEDNGVNQWVARLMLERLGQNVTLVADGRAAIESWQESNWDVILMDCQMPTMDGFEATQEIRRLEESIDGPATPIVAMTAGVTEEERQRCFDCGMNDFIAKPVSAEILRTVVGKYIAQSDEPTS